MHISSTDVLLVESELSLKEAYVYLLSIDFQTENLLSKLFKMNQVNNSFVGNFRASLI